MKLEPCAGRAAADNLWAPPTFVDRRAAAIDNLKRSSDNVENRTKFFRESLKKFFWPTKIDRRAAADTMTSAHGSRWSEGWLE